MSVSLLLQFAVLVLLGVIGTHYVCRPLFGYIASAASSAKDFLSLFGWGATSKFNSNSELQAQRAVAEKRAVSGYLPYGAAGAMVTKTKAMVLQEVGWKNLMVEIHKKDGVVMRQALSTCVKALADIELLRPTGVDDSSYIFGTKARVGAIGRDFAGALDLSLQVAALGFDCLDEGIRLFKILKKAASIDVLELTQALEDLREMTHEQSKKSTKVMETFDGILTKLAKESKKGREELSRTRERQAEAEKEAFEDGVGSAAFAIAGTVVGGIALTAATGGVATVGAAVCSLLATGGFSSALDNFKKARKGKATAHDLSQIIDNLEVARTQVQPFHAFWKLLDGKLLSVLAKLRKISERYGETAVIGNLQTTALQENWQEAQALLMQYQIDMDAEIKYIRAQAE